MQASSLVAFIAGLCFFPLMVSAQSQPNYSQANTTLPTDGLYMYSTQNQLQYNQNSQVNLYYNGTQGSTSSTQQNFQNQQAQQNNQQPYDTGNYYQTYYYQGFGTPGSLGMPGNLGTPGNLGNPGGLGTPGSGLVPEGGVVPDFTPKALTPRALTSHLLVERPGVGDQCKAGITAPGSWEIGMSDPLATKDDLVRVVETATVNDTRLRSVHIYDDRIDMYYLQPAYVWGFIPSNYLLHVTANGNTLRISLDKPKWATKAQNQHAQVSAAFSMYVPQYLNDHVVDQLEVQDLIARDAKMVEVISAVMYQVPVSPISNSFFVCYIMPYLLYISILAVIIGISLYFLIKRIRRETGFLVKKIHKLEGDDEDDDIQPPHQENDRYDADHVTQFKIPKQ
jgi:hypothetical protein